jgi:hypothetical protein
MDGPLLLQDDLATGLTFTDGDVTINPIPGFGATPHTGLLTS